MKNRIIVEVNSEFVPHQSNPVKEYYLFSYHVRIRNKSKLRRALINHIIDYTKSKDLKKLLRIVDTLPLKDIDGKEQTKEKRNPPV